MIQKSKNLNFCISWYYRRTTTSIQQLYFCPTKGPWLKLIFEVLNFILRIWKTGYSKWFYYFRGFKYYLCIYIKFCTRPLRRTAVFIFDSYVNVNFLFDLARFWVASANCEGKDVLLFRTPLKLYIRQIVDVPNYLCQMQVVVLLSRCKT